MTTNQINLLFQPGNHKACAQVGASLQEAASLAGFVLNTPCGGIGKCGKCIVRFIENAPAPTENDRTLLSEEQVREGWRLACQIRLAADAVIEIPEKTLLGTHHQIQVVGVGAAKRIDAQADIRKIPLQLKPPSLADEQADVTRLNRALAEQTSLWDAKEDGISVPLALLREFGALLRNNTFKGNAVLRGHCLIDFEPESGPTDCCVIAFDIGTTTLAASLLRLPGGQELAAVSAMNPQCALGDDVLSRIDYAGKAPAGIHELRHNLLCALHDMTNDLCRKAGIENNRIYGIFAVGNTTMLHLLCGVSPASLGVAPFVPAFTHAFWLDNTEFGLPVHPNAAIYIFPSIGGFVGGDTVAGILATELMLQEAPALLVDIGTNGEIVLWDGKKLWAASTAAGPAFEGARISQGMRAALGAIEKVLINEDVSINTIGNLPPRGICGSGLIDAIGQMLKAGLLTLDGRIKEDAELMEAAAPLRQRIRRNANGPAAFLLAASMENDILITQQDIRELQLGAAAIRAGITLLLRQAGLRPDELNQVFIAGGFGSFIRRDNAQRIGLIPHELPHEKIKFVGNVALQGAKWAAADALARCNAERIAQDCTHVELSQDPDFAMEFAMAMYFPAV